MVKIIDRIIRKYKKDGLYSLLKEIIYTIRTENYSLITSGIFNVTSKNKYLRSISYYFLKNVYKLTASNSVSRQYDNKVSSIGILGRGPSLKHVHEINFLDRFIILNNFEKDLSDTTVYNTIRNKELIHLSNIEEFTLSIRNTMRLNLIRYQLRVVENGDGEYWWRDQRKHRNPETKGIDPTYLPDEIENTLKENFPEGIISIGLIAVLFAAERGYDNIYTVGIDFFENGKYLRKEITEERELHQMKKTEKMKNHMIKIAEIYPKTQFHLITTSDFDSDQSNINVYMRRVSAPIQNRN